MINSGRPTRRLTLRFLLAMLSTTLVYAQAPSNKENSSVAAAPATASAGSPASPDKVVLKVGSRQVSAADFDSLLRALNPQLQQSVASQGRRRLGEQYAMLLLLSQQAMDEHLDSSPDVQRQMEVQRMQLLANAAYANLTRQAEPKPEEINQYYSAHKEEFEEAQVRKVTVRKKAEGAKDNATGLDPQQAKARATAIRTALASGNDLKKVAEDYKNSTDTLIDPEPRTLRSGQFLKESDKAVFRLKEGELTELQETPQDVSFMQVIKHQYRDLNGVTSQIQKKLQREKVEAAVADLKKKAPVWMDEDYFKPPQPPAAKAPQSSPAATPGALSTPAGAKPPASTPESKPTPKQ